MEQDLVIVIFTYPILKGANPQPFSIVELKTGTLYQIKSKVVIIKIVSKLMSTIFGWKGLGPASTVNLFFIKVKRCCILFLCDSFILSVLWCYLK